MQKIKKILNSIWNEFVYGGHLLSLGLVSVVFSSAILLDIKITLDFLIIVYLGTQIAYLYNRYKEFKKDYLTNPERTQHLKIYIHYIPWIILCFSLALFGILYYNRPNDIIIGAILILLGIAYSKFLKKFTKKIAGFKNIFVSLMGLLLIFFLAHYYGSSFALSLVLIVIFVCLRWFINSSFFDIKDIKIDEKEGLLTLPIIWGEKKSLNILKSVTIIAAIPIILGYYLKFFPIFSLMLLFTIPYSFYYFKKSQDKKANSAFLYNVIVDGEFILWSFFILFGKFLL
jgi:4-hydroxy-3-methylbut-2-enyl diphosphate reductase